VAAPVRHERRRQPGQKPRSGRPAPVPAASLPVARVAVDVSLPHLDRPFDYLVPELFTETAVPGCRVRVRFAGRLIGGYLLDRAAASEHPGDLAYLQRVVSPEPVLTAEIAGLARAVADRYAGSMADVLRLAIPPRHAAAESGPRAAEPSAVGPLVPLVPVVPVIAAGLPDAGPWGRYASGASFLAALAAGRAPRAIWTALPGPAWPGEIALAAAATAAAGRGTVIVVPDARDLLLVDSALAAVLQPGGHVSLSADLGPAERYRRWLAVARRQVRVVCGTRSAMFAPVADLGLTVIWDDGDDLHAEPRAPYPHAREVLALRAHRCGAAALIGGFARTAEAAQLISGGWARPLEAARGTVRRFAPTVSATGADAELARDEAAQSARLPSLALRAARAALAAGPVLFQVPRRGYLAAVSCERCHARACCAACGGPVALPAAGASPQCGWCGRPASGKCSNCGHGGLRALITGAGRTAEELGRAFPAVPVRTSGRSEVLVQVSGSPAVVVATPGAEPRAEGGYAAAVLLDSWALLGRASLRAGEEALRRWMNAAALVRPGRGGGTVIVVADAGLPVVQALIRWDPATHADRELGERRELGFPPAARMASVTGAAEAVQQLVSDAGLPPEAELLGPVAAVGSGGASHDPDIVRFLIRVPRSAGSALAAALQAGQRVRSARKDPRPVRLQLDPAELI
jgi:primosomal protein N' (replication factor Y)